ncbi:TetR/AcrR family transcriptional regulator [Kitasatospora purpeofusca]|uniref:TetR/AcrR family transcriptional regulator n=1 Tax=Kitasatospora purpeofusca TaxID=67352 RepID=UPI002A5A857E|nr:TetR/AcrR family transcriptional regulator C-terminal domain-containing protein [Kitasatospora purpeofusca]MDY0815445.1 TetR/AcrR family transcriptional regulator C-terminal domain-containing protein [Kitasatospora purpeofusca]
MSDSERVRRTPLNRERVLAAAVAFADREAGGTDALSMRKLAQELGVVPMALYKHVAGKEELLAGMVDTVVGGIDPPAAGADWKEAVRERVLSARRVLRRHPWAPRVLESLPAPTPAVLGHLDAVIGLLRAGGLSADLAHHAMHALGGRLLGFTQELFDTSPDAAPDPRAAAQLAAHYPHIAEVAASSAHVEADGTTVGGGCDDQFEFEFALDVLLDGIERLHLANWTSTGARRAVQ